MLSDDELKHYSKLIKETHGNVFAKVAGVTRDMAQKYKNFSSYPPLEKAIKIEDKLKIPARAWVDIRKLKETT
jgi:predicted transcriptional regulator